jgi:hypothetical protein
MAKHVYIGEPGKHMLPGAVDGETGKVTREPRPCAVGEVVELTDDAAAAFADRFELASSFDAKRKIAAAEAKTPSAA